MKGFVTKRGPDFPFVLSSAQASALASSLTDPSTLQMLKSKNQNTYAEWKR